MRPTRTMLIAAPVVVCLALAPTHCTLAPGSSDYGSPSTEVVSPACDPDGRAPCPDDRFVCVTDDAGNKYCEGQEPATPDGGDWDCVVEGPTLVCTGDEMPSDGGDWYCHEVAPGEVICRRNAYVPAGGGEGGWDCYYVEDHLVCESDDGGGDSPADDASGSSSDDGSDGCPPGVEMPTDELCGDGVDNDCDGAVDEDCGTPPGGETPPGDGDDPPSGDEPPPGDGDEPPTGDEPPPGDGDEPPTGDEPPPGDGDEPPPGCVCIPGAWRYCDTPTYCRWGVQYCDADGMAWGACTETSPPTICSYVASWYSPDAEACCVAAGFCCQDMWDLDFDGDVWESLGDCTDIECV